VGNISLSLDIIYSQNLSSPTCARIASISTRWSFRNSISTFLNLSSSSTFLSTVLIILVLVASAVRVSLFKPKYSNVLVLALIDIQNGMVAIHPRHNKLIIALRTAVENGEDSLDKEATSHDDYFDSFRLSLMFWH
jgi:hypothetical protein